jgi:hypothetical protein
MQRVRVVVPEMERSELVQLTEILDGSDIPAASERLWEFRAGQLCDEDAEAWRRAASWLNDLGLICDKRRRDCVLFFTENEGVPGCARALGDAGAERDESDDVPDDDEDEAYDGSWDGEWTGRSQLGRLANEFGKPVSEIDERWRIAAAVFDARLLETYGRNALPFELMEYVRGRISEGGAFLTVRRAA